MSTNNELIAMINDVRSQGSDVKTIRKQKYAPADFYMTLTNGRQVGPIKCEGSTEELAGKFAEAQSYLASKQPPRLAA